MARLTFSRSSLATTGQIACRVRELRRERGLSVRDLHEKIKGAEVKPFRGVSLSWLYKLERGRLNDIRPYTYQVPTVDGRMDTHHAGMAVVIGRIAYVLGVEPQDILSA